MKDHAEDLKAAVKRDYEAWADETPERKKAVKIARIICANVAGGSVDDVVMGFPYMEPLRAGYNQIGVYGRFSPAWAHFLDAAEAIIKRYDEL